MSSSPTSRIPGFYKLDPAQRRAALGRFGDLSAAELRDLDSGALGTESAALMIENVIGTFELPLGVGINFLINGVDRILPMAVEEPSVVAAASNMARIVRDAGGFQADVDDAVMIGQVQLQDVRDAPRAVAAIEAHRDELLARMAAVHPQLVAYGGGPRGMDVRTVVYDEPGETPETMVVLHFYLDCADAMGANMVNTVAERLAPRLAELTGARVGLRILSNLASRRLARASCSIPVAMLDMDDAPGAEVAEGIAAAWRFAWADPWRAATHNKGIMNGVDPLVIATGNDWRAIEAGAHAWAARDGQYRSLSTWKLRLDADLGPCLRGNIELPMQVGTVGGTLRNHPTVRTNLKLLGEPSARELGGYIAVLGLAQNLGALRALSTEGIQRGHMRMHARSVAAQAGAVGDEVDAVVDVLCAEHDFTAERATAALRMVRDS